MIYRHQVSLQDLYNKYLEKHKQTGEKPYPDKLLALLLLQEKENYHPEHLANGAFYNKYKEQIDKKIEQVIKDFDLNKEDIITFIEKKGILYREETYEHDKIWFVFCEGFASVIGTQQWRPSLSPEQAYNDCYNLFFGQYRKEPKQKRKKAIEKARCKRLILERNQRLSK